MGAYFTFKDMLTLSVWLSDNILQQHSCKFHWLIKPVSKLLLNALCHGFSYFQLFYNRLGCGWVVRNPSGTTKIDDSHQRCCHQRNWKKRSVAVYNIVNDSSWTASYCHFIFVCKNLLSLPTISSHKSTSVVQHLLKSWFYYIFYKSLSCFYC